MGTDLEQQALEHLRSALRPHQLPVDPIRLAQQLGVRLAIRPLQAREALYLRTRDETRIFLDRSLVISGRLSARGRFTLAHELGHHVVEELLRSGSRPPLASHDELEAIADRLGSNILVPRDLLTAEIRKLQPTSEAAWVEASTVAQLQTTFRVSLPALTHAIREVAPRTLVVRFERMQNQHSGRPSGKVEFRVAWSSPVSAGGERLFLNQTLEKYAALSAAAEKGQVVVTEAELRFRPLKQGLYPVSGAPHRLSPGAAYLLSIEVPTT